MAQQTAVEWICMQLLDFDNHKIWPSLLERAKNMEKEQIQQTIGIPTDDEIEKNCPYFPKYDNSEFWAKLGFLEGAKWIKNQIINKTNENNK